MEQRYRVTVDREEFVVSVEHYKEEALSESSPKDADSTSVELLFGAMKVEYEALRKRSEKLDNKVYILLTVCAFLFTAFESIFGKFSHNSMPCASFETFFLTVITLTVVLFLILLVLLLLLLKPVWYKWIDPHKIEKGAFMLKKEHVAQGLCELYQKSWDYNKTLLDSRYTKLRWCTNCAIGVIILLFVLMLFVYFKPGEEVCVKWRTIVMGV